VIVDPVRNDFGSQDNRSHTIPNMPSDPHSWSRAWADLRADLDRYRFAEGRPTVVNLYVCPGTVASVHYRVAHWAWNGGSPLHLAARVPLLILHRLVEVWSGVGIAPQATIGPGLYIGHFGEVIINGDAVLGTNVNLSQGVTIGVAGRGERRGNPVIGDRVYVAPGAKLIGPITVGDDAAIGANAVVTRNVADRAVVGGVPARVIGSDGSFDFVLYRSMETDPPRLASLAQIGAGASAGIGELDPAPVASQHD
jgi:serine O-acetyltransferase